MPKPEKKKRGRPPVRIAMTTEEATGAIDRMLGKMPPAAPEPNSAPPPRVRIKRTPKK